MWWASVRTPRRKIEREERLPELKPSVSVPEALRRRSEARLRNQQGTMLQRGQVWLEHSIEADDALQLAHRMKELNEPFLVLSRQSPARIENHLKQGWNTTVGCLKQSMNVRLSHHSNQSERRWTPSLSSTKNAF